MIKSKLRYILALRESNQRKLSEATHIRPATISAINTGTIKHLPMDVLDKICDTLDCQPGDIFEFIRDDKGEE